MATAATLMIGLHGPAAQALPSGAAKDSEPATTDLKSVPGRDVGLRPVPIDATGKLDVTKRPAVSWPSAGAAEVRPTSAAVDPRLGFSPRSRAQVSPAELAKGKAGALPVWLSVPAPTADRSAVATAESVPAKVRVESLGRQGNQFVLKLHRADKTAATGRTRLTVSYQQFRDAFGGDYASRLKVYQLPACGLNKSAPAPGCTPKPLDTVNDASGVLSADVPVAPAGSLDGTFAIAPAASSGAGDFKATALRPSATWTVGSSSGDFSWSYPMKSPPALGGPVPQTTIGYSSGGVDGRTSATNNQPSWVGEGFEFAPGGSIERRYASCGSKLEKKNANNANVDSGDQCWATDNATYSLNGGGGELIKDDATGEWRARNDDGSIVKRLTGANNGARNGEYWELTSKDGTKYYFGLNRLPGWDKPQPTDKAETQSVSTLPVFGNHKDEPCNKATFAESWCTQGYKWALDYVVDRNGNTMSLYYDRETNNYGRAMSATKVSTYTRANNVKRIEYGQTDGNVYQTKPVAQILFETADRCIASAACTPADYPDTPLDQECNSTTNCNNKFNPSFWTKKRLTKVTTQVWRAAENRFGDVSSWTLRQSFRDPGDGTRAGLWLESISEAGLVGQPQQLPEVNFDGIQLANRVTGDNLPPMNWLRVNTVRYGSGGQITVKYSAPDCKPGDVPAAADDNTRRCHPMKWTPSNDVERTDWFNKYVVEQVTETDRLTSTRPAVTKVEYLSAPAWRRDDEDGLVEIGMKTWSQWRGYSHVRVTKGDGTDGPPTVTENRYFQGMDGDQKADGTVKHPVITDSNGTKVPDLAPLSGQTREQTTLNGTEIVDRTINDQWVSEPTASNKRDWGTVKAYQSLQGGNTQVQTVAGGGLRKMAAKNNYDAKGVLKSKYDANDVTTAADDTCTYYEYASNAGAGMSELIKREYAVSVACDQPYTKEQVISDQRTYFDGATDVNATPTKGNPTKTERVASYDAAGNPVYDEQSKLEYDAIGRAVRATDAEGGVTTTTYSPAGGGPVTEQVVTKANGHTTTKSLEPAWGKEVAVVDQSGRASEAEYDAFGRTTKVWLPGRTGSPAGQRKLAGTGKAYTADNAAVPNMSYEYRFGVDVGTSSVITRSLQSDGSVKESYELSDGLLRPLQKQEAAPGNDGRTLTETWYDSRGLAAKELGPYWSQTPLAERFSAGDQNVIPTQKLVTFDGAGRTTEETFKSARTVKWSTKRKNSANEETVEPQQGEQATTKVTNGDGRVTELRQYHGQTATGTFDKTSYEYNTRGLPTMVTDPAGNKWTWEYDLQGRKTKEVDPDKGTSRFTYNDLDQLVTATDNLGTTLEYSYDLIGRKTAIHEVPKSGAKKLISEWKYDATPVAGQPGSVAKGNISSTTHWVDGQPYTTKYTEYDKSGKPLGQEVVIPSSQGGLAGTYKFGSTYKEDGELASSTLPAVGGLPAETLQYGYNDADLPTTLSSDLTTYVTGTAYTSMGEVQELVQRSTNGKSVTQKYDYEPGTRRMNKVTTEKETSDSPVSIVRYAFDATGNITKITDAGESTDTQCFTYDHLRRLTSAWTPGAGDCAAAPNKDALGGPAPYWHSWTFDLTGNRKSETRTSANGTTTATYNYPATGQPRPHAVQSVVTTGGAGGTRTDNYTYDETGNLKTRNLNGAGVETFDWDAQGKLVKVAGAGKTTEIITSADGDRLIRKDPSGSTLYLPGGNEVLLKPDGSLTGTRHYKHGQQVVAVRVGANQLSWLGADHHGTATTVIDNTAAQNVQRRRMDPYGNLRGPVPAWPSQRSFVGGTADPSTGFVHLGAREYDPTTGRFISVDPEANYQDPQTINGYSYSNNNPISFTDPDGNSWFSSVVSSVTSALKTTVENVVSRVAETIKVVVPILAPVVEAVWNAAEGLWKKATDFVNATIEVAKTVYRTVVKPIVKKTFAVLAKVSVAAKSFSSQVKNEFKRQVANKIDAVANNVKNIGSALSSAGNSVKNWAQSESGRKVLHLGTNFLTGVLSGLVAGLACGPAFMICGAVIGAAAGSVIGAGLHTGVAALTGEKITPGKIGQWANQGATAGLFKGIRKITGSTGWDMIKGAKGRGLSGLGSSAAEKTNQLQSAVRNLGNWGTRQPGLAPGINQFLPK
ncbi:RHS repeat protein [Kribbella sandramycini]|uniref:RHS repeat protein n=1 Tax=Kribbella sandramycini TaxID=60450 RepID=A0A7Y4KY38_9ACTN|nr:RHS repeat-associated core domain-containing protein [Kribbella sandramycini]MBB6569368.1 RHS repeat-associated protein [Kribbella sandramycini]NOL40793.1 RHS repeat protein [Kribbella sandramycini]